LAHHGASIFEDWAPRCIGFGALVPVEESSRSG